MKTPFLPTVQTVRRKLSRSLAQRGVLGTAGRCFYKPWEILRRCVRGLLPHERTFQAEELAFDRRYHVDTCAQQDPGWMARIGSPNWMHGIGYAPVPIGDVTRILSGLPIDHEQFVFIDMGAGKGRAVLVSAQFPFKRIVGVEYSPALAHVMTANCASYHNPRQRCRELECLLQDATLYELPLDPLVLFFHHPFEAVIFCQVLERIENSLAAHPRKILVIYYDPHCKVVFDESSRFRLLWQGNRDERYAASNDWVVYESLSPAASMERS